MLLFLPEGRRSNAGQEPLLANPRKDLVELPTIIEVHLLRIAQPAEQLVDGKDLNRLEGGRMLLQHGL